MCVLPYARFVYKANFFANYQQCQQKVGIMLSTTGRSTEGSKACHLTCAVCLPWCIGGASVASFLVVCIALPLNFSHFICTLDSVIWLAVCVSMLCLMCVALNLWYSNHQTWQAACSFLPCSLDYSRLIIAKPSHAQFTFGSSSVLASYLLWARQCVVLECNFASFTGQSLNHRVIGLVHMQTNVLSCTKRKWWWDQIVDRFI